MFASKSVLKHCFAPVAVLRQYFSHWLNRRIPGTRSITLSQRSIFIFPSKIGSGFLVLLVLMLLCAINYQNALIFGLTFLLTSMLIVAILHTYKNLSGLTLEFVGSQPGFVDEPLEFSIKVTRPPNSMRHSISLSWKSQDMQWVELVDANSHTLRLFSASTHRGIYRPNRLLVETCYPIGLLRAWTWIDLQASVVVYPKPVFDHRMPASSTVSDQGDMPVPHGNEDFYGLRSYQPGDPIKHVSWRGYARTDKLLINEFVDFSNDRLMLDWHQLQGDSEYRLSVLTGLVIQAARQEKEYGLRLPNTEIRFGHGPAHFKQALTELALYGHAG